MKNTNNNTTTITTLSPAESTKHLMQWETAAQVINTVSPIYTLATKKLMKEGEKEMQSLLDSLVVK